MLCVFLSDLNSELKKYTFHITIFGLLGASLLLFLSQGYEHSLFMGMITIDPFSHFFKWLFLIATILVIIVSRYTKELEGIFIGEYYGLILILLFGLFLMSSSTNLLMIVLSIETVSISSYILAGMLKFDRKSNESALKYVIFGAFASGIMVYGMSWLYGYSGSTDIYKIHLALIGMEDPFIIYMAIVMIIAGFGYKIAMVPFHYWSPDVYEGAPTPITAFFAIVPKVSAIALIYRFCLEPFADFYNDWRQIVIFLSLTSMFVGAFAAIVQTNIKRLLAYSSIGHIGYALIGLASANSEGVKGVIIYMLVYVLMNIGIFSIILSLK